MSQEVAERVGLSHQGRYWSNRSVLAFAAGKDPIVAAREVARELYDAALEAGAGGPPVDVLALAERLGLALNPRDDLIDAQIRVIDGRMSIEYNPGRPRGRLRFSIAHELAHSRFPDVADQPRHRTAAGSVESVVASDDWELELICDIIAAELLMPDSSVAGLLTIDPDIDFFMEARRRLDVSTEALLRRVVGESSRPILLVAASRPMDMGGQDIRVDYVDRSPRSVELLPALEHGERVDGLTTLLACSAVGQTSRGMENVKGVDVRVQAVGVPAYPGRRWPRILALVEPISTPSSAEGIEFVTGDIVTAGSNAGPVIIAHVVPDSTRGWSRFGVGGALTRAFPLSASSYRGWVLSDPANQKLGNVHFSQPPGTGGSTTIASLVAQAGFGRSTQPRLDYHALSASLASVADVALRDGATVHVPRLGAGQAGGRWDMIQDILLHQLTSKGVPVVVHTLPASGGSR
ncbi:ImmA/IrrE family metallo-endopeptidase [Microbacterium sp. LjRoot45]|uniref:ImmA/IrrE family metallo-endopeptidase n=1 Tax=Microbacterium sp. LjRoot45 TaxID=3342329 RepID=UPI003ECE7144